MSRHGEKKFDRWEFRIEARTFEVDVYIIRARDGYVSDKTRFRAVNKELELRIENTDIDALRRDSKAFVEKAGKTEWSTWLRYAIDYSPLDSERGDFRVGIKVEWTIIERCDIGTSLERWRDVEKDGKVRTYGRIETGAPKTGFVPRWRDENSKDEFSGVIPYSKDAVLGLEALAKAIGSVYDRLRDVLFPGTKTDPAKWLGSIAVSGVPLLPLGGRKEAKQ